MHCSATRFEAISTGKLCSWTSSLHRYERSSPASSASTHTLAIGSGEYNRQLRGIAISKGYKLSEYGIYKVDDTGEHQIAVQTEDDIFNILGVPYRSPDQRSL
jgi:DNA polymerase/3'-5' exonuclease PolX